MLRLDRLFRCECAVFRDLAELRRRAVSDDGRDDSTRIDAAHLAPNFVNDIERPVRAHIDVPDLPEPRVGGRPTIAAVWEARLVDAGERGDNTGRVDPPDGSQGREVEASVGTEGHPAQTTVDERLRRRSAVTRVATLVCSARYVDLFTRRCDPNDLRIS